MSLKPLVRLLAVVSLTLTTALTVGCQSTYMASGPAPNVGMMGAASVGTIGNPDHTASEFGMRGH